MDFSDGSYMSTSWATFESDPFHDGKAACLSCASPQRPPAPTAGTPAPPPRPGQAPCVACPADSTFAQRLNARDSGPPCCVTETYGYAAPTWPWQWGGNSSTPAPPMAPELWQDLYAVKNRALTGFDLSPTFNPYVL